MDLESNILSKMKKQGIKYQSFEHEPVYTNPAMAEALNVKEQETIKSLVVKTKEGNLAVVILPGNEKLDWKKAAAAAYSKKVSLAKPEVVLEQVGCEVGCVPPFGHKNPLPVIMDSKLNSFEYVYFNPGVHHKSFQIKTKDLIHLCDPEFMPE